MVKRTVSNEISTPSFEFNKGTYDINDVDSVLYFLYGLLGYQLLPVRQVKLIKEYLIHKNPTFFSFSPMPAWKFLNIYCLNLDVSVIARSD